MSPSSRYVNRLIDRLLNEIDLNTVSTHNLGLLYKAINDVYDTDNEFSFISDTCSSYHQKLEELLGTRQCDELDANRRVLNGQQEPY